ncbi:MAG: hypothetical protein IKX20_11200 [Paludibacteraceae bacterium]|nr:hypothetical protein [Paludibacteraceae bacterium]
MRIPTIKMKLDVKAYREYNENGDFVREGDDLKKLSDDANEFGGFVIDGDNKFVGGFEWCYEEWLEHLKKA